MLTNWKIPSFYISSLLTIMSSFFDKSLSLLDFMMSSLMVNTLVVLLNWYVRLVLDDQVKVEP